MLFTSHLKDNTPGGSSHGIKANKNKIVTGVVFHINLLKYTAELEYDRGYSKFPFLVRKKIRKSTYARAVQLLFFCRLDQRILFIALGIIHTNAIQAPKKLNCRSVTVATATPIDTTVKAKTCIIGSSTQYLFIKKYTCNHLSFVVKESRSINCIQVSYQALYIHNIAQMYETWSMHLSWMTGYPKD